MAEDHLDRETSVSGEITPTGVKASARSRFVAAIDRLGGNLVELLNAPMEAKTKEQRAVTDARVRMIEGVTSSAIERFKADPAFAERAMRTHLENVFERQENKDAVIDKTIQELRRQPPTEEEASSGPETIDGTFMNRFERYAEEATSDVLREKWARVLGAEIRKPGTFGPKVLRAIDELDAATASLFERFCAFRLADVVPKSLVELPFSDEAALVSADLLVAPGLGQIVESKGVTDEDGTDLWVWKFDRFLLAFLREPPFTAASGDATTVTLQDGKPVLPVYVLTEVGRAVSAILEDRSGSVVGELALKLHQAIPKATIRTYYVSGVAARRVQEIPPLEGNS